MRLIRTAGSNLLSRLYVVWPGLGVITVRTLSEDSLPTNTNPLPGLLARIEMNSGTESTHDTDELSANSLRTTIYRHGLSSLCTSVVTDPQLGRLGTRHPSPRGDERRKS